jgi:hypothetical protein
MSRIKSMSFMATDGGASIPFQQTVTCQDAQPVAMSSTICQIKELGQDAGNTQPQRRF